MPRFQWAPATSWAAVPRLCHVVHEPLLDISHRSEGFDGFLAELEVVRFAVKGRAAFQDRRKPLVEFGQEVGFGLVEISQFLRVAREVEEFDPAL